MKVKLFSNYDRSENILKRFMANYDVYDDALTFVLTDDYDFAVAFNGSREWIDRNKKIITVVQEPSWSIAHCNNFFLINSDYLLVHDPELFERTCRVKLGGEIIESPSYMFYHDHKPRSFFDGAEFVQKKKKISIIVSATDYSVGNYIKRLSLVEKILESDLDIDIYGRGFGIQDRRYKGELEYKHTGLLPYEYSIAIENSNEKNYITEKFVDCVLCNTIPIYNGAPNIKEIYDERYFKLIDLNSPTIIQDIISIITSPPPVYSSVNKDIYFNHYNLYTKLKEIIYNNG